MATAPVFSATPNACLGQLTAANTARDGTGTIVDVFTAGNNGSRVEHIDIEAAAAVTAGVVRLFLYDGTNIRLWKEILVTATTPSTTVAAWNYSVDCSIPSKALILPTGWKVKASTHNAETFNVAVIGGNF